MTTAIASPLPSAEWVVVNDTVMGGVSSSQVSVDEDDGVIFEGLLSLENNGGFTSTRAILQEPGWYGADGVRIQLAGDGRTYLATIRIQNPSMRRLYYRYPIETTAGQTTDVTIPLSDFDCYAYGQQVAGAPTLSSLAGQIASVGFMLADKVPGDFRLNILEVSPTGALSDTPTLPNGTVQDVLAMAITQGVPLFNAGEPQRCADIYRTAVQSALLLGSDQLSTQAQSRLNQALQEAAAQADPSSEAWVLRYAMDSVMAGQ